uniref:Serine/threonine-protein phosphatase n=1 Tax=Panagrolaimus davidi TaxID=227884 RepID=A0A914QQR8_9BILA
MPLDIDEFISRLLNCVDCCGKVTNVLNDTEEIKQLIDLVRPKLHGDPVMIEPAPPINIAGDLHGQFWDLLRIFKHCGIPPDKKFLFLGDYVDRANYSLETISLLFAFKVKYPSKIFLLRGNHECSAVNLVYGFFDELNIRFKAPFGEQLWNYFQKAFNVMPMSALIGEKILCMHGGLSPNLRSLEQLKKIPRPCDPSGECLQIDLLWADPGLNMPSGRNDPLYGDGTRGCSYAFNKRAVHEICNIFGLDVIVRGHQVVMDGYEFFADRKLVTVFSAPNYCGEFNNKAAVMHIEEDLAITFTQIDPLKGNKKARKRHDETDIDDDLDKLIADEEEKDGKE